MRATLMTSTSIFLTGAVIGNAFYQKKQFYPSVVYITKSNTSMAIVYLQCLVFFLLVGKLMRRIFFGTLRAAELEHLIERGWYAVTETCLTFAVFRDDLSPKFVALFAVLLFLKCFHWLVEDRVDFMERSPNIVISFHVRIVCLLLVLASCDLGFIFYSHPGSAKDSGYQLIFGFEYAILLANILNIVIKYSLHWYDLASDSQWDEKAAFLLYLEVLMSLLKLFLYSVFVMQMLRYHGFPLFALRPIYLCIRTFKKACSDVVMSRRAIRNMNTLYPTVTQDELSQTDNVCIICREEMNAESGTAKKLPCNHIFHVSCLRSWFQRQQTCPTCRMDILRVHTRTPLVPGAVPIPGAGRAGQMGAQVAFGSAAAAAAAPGASVAGLAGLAGASVQSTQAMTQEQLVAVMAQMFVQAMLNHLQVLQQQQHQQQQQQQQQIQQLQQQLQQLQLQQQQQQQPQQPQQQQQPQQPPQQPPQPQQSSPPTQPQDQQAQDRQAHEQQTPNHPREEQQQPQEQQPQEQQPQEQQRTPSL